MNRKLFGLKYFTVSCQQVLNELIGLPMSVAAIANLTVQHLHLGINDCVTILLRAIGFGSPVACHCGGEASAIAVCSAVGRWNWQARGVGRGRHRSRD